MAAKKMRLDKLLSNMGFGSRTDIKKDIKAGMVVVNGKIAKSGSDHIDAENDEIIYNGEKVEYREFIYLLMNKPAGVVSATYDNFDETVIDLLDEEYRIFEPFPVGRLDKDTEGLLVITNDGALSHRVLSPKKHVSKTYYAELKKPLDERTVNMFKEGIELEDFKTMPAEVEAVSEDGKEVLATIKEGKFHQVKRMFKACSNEVLFLKRVKMGSLELDNTLEAGEYREMTKEELRLLEKR